ncbi:MAG: hypothetical protein HRT66_10150 [Flavobacteriaceae bacterium]|nr:hypothetical protein [Flavobacteriaceae bacterium]
MKQLIIIVIVLISLCGNAQEQEYKYSREQFHGIWKGVEMSRDPFADITDEYKVYTKNRMLSFYVNSDWLHSYYFGFNGYFGGGVHPETYKNSIVSLLDNGNFYYTSREDGSSIVANPPPEFVNVTETTLEIPWDIFEKITTLPQTALRKLYQHSITNKRNYIREFLEIGVRKITTDKTYIYKERGGNNRTNMYLVKGDIIEVISAYPKRVNLKYETAKGKIITGWVKKEDVSESLNKLIEASKKK